MQSSYKIIKNSNVVSDGYKEIVTEFEGKPKLKQIKLSEDNAKLFIDNYENLAKTMVENAREKADKLLSNAYSEAHVIQKKAYEKGYNNGQKKGYDDAYSKAYEEGYKKNVDKALKEAEVIKNNADNVLKSAVEQKDSYLKEKEKIIRNLIVDCIESILKQEVKDKASLDNVVFEALSQVKNAKVFIIKSKKVYCDEFKDKIDLWKDQIPFNGDIFIIPDESIEDGSVIIERDNGKVKFGVDIAVQKIKELFKNED
ncbi:flagellar assembly protein FliH [Clostridium sp. JN-1]|uniref:FliH/SctL family protein n=1 Tax=Clostridium sp. JN-1 TaxID=2483110 RepID=UPI000F0B4433|nr:flagellar assembly protein FliH [Clostridium sp. JN-1]